jgi:hypothetical protein
MHRISAAILALTIGAGTARAVTIWDEAIQGDLSNNNNSPAALTLGLGVNSVKGTMGRDLPQNPVDRDMFTFTIAAGRALTSINVVTFTPTNQSFYAIAPGTSINDTDPATHLANTLVQHTGDILPQMALGSYSGGTGITDPLGPGTYTVWFQELSSVVTYQMDYTIVSVPEPATVCTGLALGLVAFGRAFARRRVSPERRMQK